MRSDSPIAIQSALQWSGDLCPWMIREMPPIGRGNNGSLPSPQRGGRGFLGENSMMAGNVKRGVECLYRGTLLKALGGSSFITEGGNRITLAKNTVVVVV